MTLQFLMAAAGGYLLGSIPFGLVLVRAAGLGDIRQVGSGNIGATNVLRTGRKDLALATLLLDAGKAGIAALIVKVLGWGDGAAALAGFSAFVGHCFPAWLGFKGGKGVATFFGTILALAFLPALIVCATWLGVAFATRYSSSGALASAVVAPAAMAALGEPAAALASLGMAAIMFYRHKENIRRLLAGTEPKIGAKKS